MLVLRGWDLCLLYILWKNTRSDFDVYACNVQLMLKLYSATGMARLLIASILLVEFSSVPDIVLSRL